MFVILNTYVIYMCCKDEAFRSEVEEQHPDLIKKYGESKQEVKQKWKEMVAICRELRSEIKKIQKSPQRNRHDDDEAAVVSASLSTVSNMANVASVFNPEPCPIPAVGLARAFTTGMFSSW